MSRAQMINYNGVNIFSMDFSNLKDVNDVKKIMDESIAYIRKQPARSVIALSNLENMHFNNEIKNLFQNFINGNKSYIKVSAVIGLSGLQRFVYNSLNKLTGRDIRAFENMTDAGNYLAKNS